MVNILKGSLYLYLIEWFLPEYLAVLNFVVARSFLLVVVVIDFVVVGGDVREFIVFDGQFYWFANG